MKTTRKVVLRPAEGWPEGWHYPGEFDVVNLEALLAPDEWFNRVILERGNAGRSTAPPSTKGSAEPKADGS